MIATEPYRLNRGFNYGPVSQTQINPAIPVEILEGKSAYEVAVEKGFIGNIDAWLLSLKSVGGYVWDQVSPAATWTIAHNLGRVPNVTVYLEGEQVFPDIEVTATQVAVTFSFPVSGKALLI